MTARDHEKGLRALESAHAYRKPEPLFIGRGPKTDALYKAEETADNRLRACALKWGDLMDIDVAGPKLYTNGMPQAMFDQLDRFELTAALLAAEAFLERYGYKVTRPGEKCIDCDGTGKYPSGDTCKSCLGSGRVGPGDGEPDR